MVCCSPRFDPSAFRSWPITYKDLAPYYLIAEKIMNVTTNYTKGSALQEILIKRLLMGGFPEARDVRLATDLRGYEIRASPFECLFQFH